MQPERRPLFFTCGLIAVLLVIGALSANAGAQEVESSGAAALSRDTDHAGDVAEPPRETLQDTESTAGGGEGATPGATAAASIIEEFERAVALDPKTARLIYMWNETTDHPAEELAGYAGSVNRHLSAIVAMERLATSERFAHAFGASGYMGDVRLTSLARAATRWMCAAALAGQYSGNTEQRYTHLVTALRLCDILGRSDNLSVHLARPVVCGRATSTLFSIYSEACPGEDEASELEEALQPDTVDNPDNSASYLRFVKAALDIPASARVCSRYVGLLDDQVRGDEPAFGKAAAAAVEVKGLFAEGKIAEVVRIQRADLAAAQELRSKALSTLTLPYFTLADDGFWRKVFKFEAVPPDAPLAFGAQGFLAVTLQQISNEIARRDLGALLLKLRRYEAENGGVPDSLDALPDHESALDPYDGEPYRYTVVKDKDGRPLSFAIYSIGSDLEDNGGVAYPESANGHYDIVVKARALRPVTE